MSGSNHDLLNSLLERKTDEVARMNTQLLAHMTNSSHSQNRLLQALDTLDECQHTHVLELQDAERRYARLERQLQEAMAAVSASESERDNLRDSVLEIVEKVEESNAIHSWPCNRLQLTRFISHPQRSASKLQQHSNEDKLAYAGTIIKRLRRERDDERAAHTLTYEESRAKIEMLEAQLARREAELEYRATRMVDTPSLLLRRNDGNIGSNSEHGKPKRSTRTGSLASHGTGFEEQRDQQDEHSEPTTRSMPALTDEQILKNLDRTAARNRALEVEIKTLYKRFCSLPSSPTAASASKTSPRLSGAPYDNTTASGVIANGRNGDGRDSGDRATDGDQQRRSRNVTRNRGNRAPAHAPSSLGQLPHDNERDNRQRARKPKELKRSQSASQLELTRGSEDIDDLDWGASGSKNTRLPPQESVILGHTISNSAILGLHNEIQALSAQIDALGRERELGMKVVATQREGSISRDTHQSENVGRAKAEVKDGDCRDNDVEDTRRPVFDKLEHRLRIVEKDCLRLRHEFEHHKLFAQAREDELLDRVQTLQNQVDDLNSQWRSKRASTPPSSYQPSSQLNHSHQQLRPFLIHDPTPGLALDVIEDDHFQATTREDDGPTTEVNLPHDTLLDTIEGEISMELATPLLPSSTLIHPEHIEYHYQRDESILDQSFEFRSTDSEHSVRSNAMGGASQEEEDCAERLDGTMEEVMVDPPTMPLPPSPPAETSDDIDGDNGDNDDNDDDDGDGDGDGGYEVWEERGDDSEAATLMMPARGGANGTSMTPPPGTLVSLPSAEDDVSLELARAERELAVTQELLEQSDNALREVETALALQGDLTP